MWCIGKLTEEYVQRMHALCDLYGREQHDEQPVVCVDEKSKQVVADSRRALPAKPGCCEKQDGEYKRLGTRNIFMAVNPKAGIRHTRVTAQRTKEQFVSFVRWLVSEVYAEAQLVHIVLDNLNTHFRKSFVDVLGIEGAEVLLSRVRFHYTPKHGSWLNLAEVEIAVMDRQCTGRRFESLATLSEEVAEWEKKRNEAKAKIKWTFTRQQADEKLSKHYI